MELIRVQDSDYRKTYEHYMTFPENDNGLIAPIESRADFSVSDEDLKKLADWYLAFCEKRELLGNTNYLLYICRKEL